MPSLYPQISWFNGLQEMKWGNKECWQEAEFSSWSFPASKFFTQMADRGKKVFSVSVKILVYCQSKDLPRVVAGLGNPNPPIWLLTHKCLWLGDICVYLEDNKLSWTSLEHAHRHGKVFGRDSAESSLCKFNLRLLIKFGKLWGKPHNLCFDTAPSPLWNCSVLPLEGIEPVSTWLWAFFQKVPSDVFYRLFNWSLELVIKRSHWLHLSY